MTDYKDTLNLPKTELAMKANLPNREPKMLDYWEGIDLNQQIRNSRKGREKFILHDGPPYANGEIHLGHSVNKVLKDIVIKSQTLNGKDVPYTPGWDCHGLPIELNVEKKIGKVGQKVTAEEFRDACRKYANSQIDIQKKDFKRLGIFGNWDKPYVTMDFGFEANIIRSLGSIINKGFIEQGEKPVHWCVDCASALAEAEVEYKDKISHSIDFAFPIENNLINKVFGTNVKEDCFVASWTTTPWTLPGNLALTVNKNFEYCLVELEINSRVANYVVGKDLIEQTLERLGTSNHTVKGTCLGQDLKGLNAKHPYLERQSLIITGDHVTTEAGTGIVHTAPGHGLEDYGVALENGLEVLSPVKSNGTFMEDVEHVSGMFVFKSNEKIIEVLKENGALLAEAQYEHSYPHCWRHKSPLMFRATPQWFIGMTNNNLLKTAKESIENVNWEPEWGKSRMASMLENRPDWCISRQRSWGVPIPLLVHKDTGELHPETDHLIEEVAKLVEENGIDAWHNLDCSSVVNNADQYDKISDSLDVWFDSGVTHACVLNNTEMQFPADLYLEGSDQHRGWFQSSLLTSIALNDVPPYKSVLTHGFVVDADGKKMSKSIGNVISPQKVWDSLGADVLRSWIASTDYRNEMVVSDEILKRSSDSYRRIRNTIRFLLGNINDFNYESDAIDIERMTQLDKWMIAKTKSLQIEVMSDFNKYQFHQAFKKIHNFCANELGGFYLDILKDRLYTSKKDSEARRSCQTALYFILEALLRWISPILSFTAEEAWQLHKPGSPSVHLLEWFNEWSDSKVEMTITDEEWNEVLLIRAEVNKVLEASRNKEVIGSALEAEIDLFCSTEVRALLDKFSDELRFVFITSDAQVFDFEEKGDSTELDGLRVAVRKTKHNKCERCWHSREEVGEIANHVTLCERCVDNIEGDGEVRLFA